MQRNGRAQQALDPKLPDRCPRVGEPAREHLVKHDTQCIDVARGADRVAQQLFWTHVGEGAWLELAGCQYSEVEHLHGPPWAQHDVLRFQVAVENAHPVHMVHRVSHQVQHTYRLRDREGSALQSLCHSHTFHVLHREEDLAVGQAVEVVDLSDARVAHPGNELRLVPEPLLGARV